MVFLQGIFLFLNVCFANSTATVLIVILQLYTVKLNCARKKNIRSRTLYAFHCHSKSQLLSLSIAIKLLPLDQETILNLNSRQNSNMEITFWKA